MTVKLRNLLVISLVLVLSFSLLAFVGCKEKMSQEEIDQIIAGAIAAQYDTVSFDIDMPMTIEVKGGDDPGTITATIAGSGFLDMVSEAMRMTIEMEMIMSGVGSQNVEGEIYVLEGWIYSGTSVPGYGEQWTKMVLTEDMWQQQAQVEPYIELLATAVEVDYKGTEIVNGVECYVLELEPDIAALSELMAEGTSGLGLAGLGSLDLAELYQELSVKEWLAVDGYFLQKTGVMIVLEAHPEDVGEASDSFDKMNMEVEMTMRYYDYNQPFTVVLPPEALEAEEISP